MNSLQVYISYVLFNIIVITVILIVIVLIAIVSFCFSIHTLETKKIILNKPYDFKQADKMKPFYDIINLEVIKNYIYTHIYYQKKIISSYMRNIILHIFNPNSIFSLKT